MAVESAAIPFPSEIIMPLAGWLLVKDAGHGFEWLFLAAFFGALGNTIGSLVAYYAGAWDGRPFRARYGRFVFITPPHLHSALPFAGSYPWSFGLAAGGFALGEHRDRLTGWFRPVAAPIAIALALLVAYYLYRRVRAALHEEGHTNPSEDEP